jgi:hypothetical protein
MNSLRKILLLLPLVLVLTITVGTSQSVYKTPSGTKYHLSTCRMVENISEKITIQEAGKLGLTPCKICKPPTTDSRAITPSKTPQGIGESTQCKGTTQKGTRCEHKTRIGNGYCYQHQPKEKT